MTKEQLKEDYAYANWRFFKNKLPDLPIRFGDLPDTVVGRTRFQRPLLSRQRWVPVEIIIDAALNRDYLACTAIQTLLHEMVHVKLGVGSSCETKNGVFEKEMRRLANAGAFQGLW